MPPRRPAGLVRPLALLLGVAFASSSGGCSGATRVLDAGSLDAGEDVSTETVGPCASDPPPEACGQSCGPENPCPFGFHCRFGTCRAECHAGEDAECGTEERCSSAGMCVPRVDSEMDASTEAGLDAELDATPDASAVCAQGAAEHHRVTPTVVLIVDQSSAMRNDLEPDLSRWDALYEALMSTEGLVHPLQSDIRFGLALYTWDRDQGLDACPEVQSLLADLDHHAAMDTIYAASGPSHATPTAATIEKLLDDLDLWVDSGDIGMFVLATGGRPDRCMEAELDDKPLAMEAAVEAIALAHAAGITTHYIDVGGRIEDADHRQAAANAGVGKSADDPQPAPYYDVRDLEPLVSTLEETILGDISCDLPLEGAIPDLALACDGVVRLNDEELPCDSEEGWSALDDRTIRFHGAACETIMAGGARLDASFPCE